MKKLLCLFIIILSLLAFTGCEDFYVDTTTEINTGEPQTSFVVVEEELLEGYWYKIVYHKDTKVMYALGTYNDFTVMLDAEGKPMIWEGD